MKVSLRLMGVAADGKAPIAYDYLKSTESKVGTAISDPSVVVSEEYYEREGKMKEEDAQEEEREEGEVQPKASPKKAIDVDTPFFVHLETLALTSKTGESTLSAPLSSNENKAKHDYESLVRVYEGLNKDKIKQLPLGAITVKKQKAAPRMVAIPVKVVVRPTEKEVVPYPEPLGGGRRVIPEEEFQMVKCLYDNKGKTKKTKTPEELKNLPPLFKGDTVSLASDQSIQKAITCDTIHTTEQDVDFEAIKRLYASSNKKTVDSLLSEVDAKKTKEDSVSKYALRRMSVLEEEDTVDSSTNTIAQVKLAQPIKNGSSIEMVRPTPRHSSPRNVEEIDFESVKRLYDCANKSAPSRHREKEETADSSTNTITQVKLAAVASKGGAETLQASAKKKSLEQGKSKSVIARSIKNGSSTETVHPTPKHSSPRNVQEIDFESVKRLYDCANKSASSPSPVKTKTPRTIASIPTDVDFESVKKLYAAGLDDVEKVDFFKTSKKSRSKKGKAAKKKLCTDVSAGWKFDEDVPRKQSSRRKTKGAAACEFPIREIELISKESSYQTKKFSISLPTDFNPAIADPDEETRDQQSPKSSRRLLHSQSRRDDSSPPESPAASKKMIRKKSKSQKNRRPGNVKPVSVPVVKLQLSQG
jgi:hypothetical protein